MLMEFCNAVNHLEIDVFETESLSMNNIHIKGVKQLSPSKMLKLRRKLWRCSENRKDANSLYLECFFFDSIAPAVKVANNFWRCQQLELAKCQVHCFLMLGLFYLALLWMRFGYMDDFNFYRLEIQEEDTY